MILIFVASKDCNTKCLQARHLLIQVLFVFSIDILVGIQYIRNGDYIWASITLGLVLVPAMIIQAFSIRWYYMDGKGHKTRTWVIHILQLQPLERYLFYSVKIHIVFFVVSQLSKLVVSTVEQKYTVKLKIF